jgi:hypothetical protein
LRITPFYASCSASKQGATRDKKTRAKALAIIDPNVSAEDFGKHMSAELGWVRVRAGREDVYATAVKQVGADRFLLCFSSEFLLRTRRHPLHFIRPCFVEL